MRLAVHELMREFGATLREVDQESEVECVQLDCDVLSTNCNGLETKPSKLTLPLLLQRMQLTRNLDCFSLEAGAVTNVHETSKVES